MRAAFILSTALFCASCATEQQFAARIESDPRAQEIIKAQIMCAERKVRQADDGVSDVYFIALKLSSRCEREYQKATEDYAQSYLDNDEQRKLFHERRNHFQERIEAFLPIVTENRLINDSQGYRGEFQRMR